MKQTLGLASMMAGILPLAVRPYVKRNRTQTLPHPTLPCRHFAGAGMPSRARQLLLPESPVLTEP